MTFEEFGLVPPGALPPEVSPVYFSLHEHVSRRQASASGKILVFCVAYTLYSVRKKDDIFKAIYKDKKAPTDERVTRSHETYQKDWAIQGILNDATVASKTATDEHTLQFLSGLVARHNAPFGKKVLYFIGDSLMHIGQLVLAVLILISFAAAANYFLPTLVKTMLHMVDDLINPFR
jgi:hypothetical protein